MSYQPIHQLVYLSTYSSARIDNGLKALREIVQASQRNNAKVGVTGYLMFDGATFVQVLEGERSVVEATYARIEPDPRHRDPLPLGTRTLAEREFAAWAMAGYLRGPQEIAIFRRHGVNGPLAEANLDAAAALALMRELSAAHAKLET